MLSFCAAAAMNETRRLIRAQAAIASARSIFTTLSVRFYLCLYFFAFSNAYHQRLIGR
jgi:hypothetical protein